MCDDCKSFMEYYFEGDPVILTEAMSAKSLLAMTEPKRQFRGDVDIVKKKIQVIDKDGKGKELERLDYIVKAKNSTEKKTHWGFVDVDPTTNNIEKLWCSCLDFALRFQVPFYKKGMSLIDVEPKYHKQELIRKGIHKNNGNWTKKTNPDGDLSLCKHLYFVIKYHLAPPKKKSEEPEEKSLPSIKVNPSKEEKKQQKKEAPPSKQKPSEVLKDKGIALKDKKSGITKPTTPTKIPQKVIPVKKPVEPPKDKKSILQPNAPRNGVTPVGGKKAPIISNEVE
jgi:hypothetical protein